VINRPNYQRALDAAAAFSLPFGVHWRRASEARCWAGKIFIPVSNGYPVCKISESAK
jgi:hypothetical protein